MLINVYKEKNWTSFDVVAKLRGVLKTKKIGHAGTLDPLAEGVLIILTDRETKKQDELMGLEKEYLAEIAFGAQSPTYDLEGELTFSEFTQDLAEFERNLKQGVKKYVGEFEQRVPPFSATKVGGERLYKKARAGTLDQREIPSKTVNVKSIHLESVEVKVVRGRSLPTAILRIVCSKGFYVRSLAHDLGQDFGVGAVLIDLTRTRVGNYQLKDAQKIDDIKPASQPGQ